MIKSEIKTEDYVSPTLKAFLNNIKGAKTSYVTIGIHNDAGEYEDGTEVYQVALFNEFGTQTAPERSFMRSAIDENDALINQWREEMVDNILNKDWSIEKALNAIGFRIQQLIQNKIKSNVPPPNEQSTKNQKEREGYADRTLIASGLMLRSVGYKVVLGK